jgi:hypothetical protein
MEPHYSNLDPQERNNRFLAVLSVLIGAASLCAGLLPIAGFITGAIGLFAGLRGRRSESKSLATLGVILSAFGLTLTLTYSIFLWISKSAQ